jgi:hypothetical protein
MTVSGRAFWKTGPGPLSGLATNFSNTTPESASGVVMDNALGGVAVGRYLSLISGMKFYEMTPQCRVYPDLHEFGGDGIARQKVHDQRARQGARGRLRHGLRNS